MIDTEAEYGKQFFRYYKIYLVIAMMAVCATLPKVFRKYLINKNDNLAVSFHEAPTNSILILSICLILVGWFFSNNKIMLTICASLLIIANGLLLQTYTVVNTDGVERRTYFSTNNESIKWENVDKIHITSTLGKGFRSYSTRSVNPIKMIVVPVLEIQYSNGTQLFNGFTTNELIDLKEWLKTQSQPKAYIQPIPDEYYDNYVQMGSSKMELMDRLFEIKSHFNEKPISLN